MPSSTLIASGTLGRVPGSTGASYQSHLVFAANSQRWWYFTAVGASSASGTATGSGQSTSQLVDTSKSFTANAFTNFSLWFTGGTGANQVIRLTGNTATALTMTTSTGESNCQTAPVAGSTTYEVINFNLIRAWVSSSSDLTTATWSEATGSSGGITFPTGQLNWAGGDSVAGGAGLNPADGRLWAVGYGSVSSKDVVYLQAQTNIHWLQNMGRATLSGSTITWDTNGNGTGTNQWFVPGASQDGIATFPSGLDVALSTSGPKWASVGGNWAPNNDANGVFNQTNETGGANPTVAWDSTTETYDSTINNNWGGGVVALGSGFMLSVFVDGGTTDTTGKVYNNLRYAESASATGWPTTNTGAAIPNLSSASNDPDDWGIVARTTTDVHVIRRNSGTALEQIRYSGHNGSWGSKVNLPTTGLTGQLAASGVAAVSDGTSVWVFVIDTDANNSVRYIKWNGSWDASWSTLSTGTEAKNFITATIRSDGEQIGVAWTANSSSPFAVNYAVLSFVTVAATPYQGFGPRGLQKPPKFVLSFFKPFVPPATLLAVPIAISGDPTSSATIAAHTGTLSSSVALSGSIAGVSGSTATLAGAVALSGTIAAPSTETGTLAAAVALGGSVVLVSSDTGTATEAIALSGSIAAPSAYTGTAITATPISGSVSGPSTFSGTLTVAIALVGTSTVVSTGTATFAASVALTATLAMVTTLAASLPTTNPPVPGSTSAYDFPAFKVGIFDAVAFVTNAYEAAAFPVKAFDSLA